MGWAATWGGSPGVVLWRAMLGRNVDGLRGWLVCMAAVAGLFGMVAGGVAAEGSAAGGGPRLDWDAASNRVTADIRDASLEAVLQLVASRTGWSVWVEPGLAGRVSTRFQDLPPGEALRRLLDRLNFTLLPQSNGPPHLYVFRTSMQDATRPVRAAAEGPQAGSDRARIVGEWIVRLKPGTDPETLARALGAEITGRIEALRAYRFRFATAEAAEAARQRLLADDAVASVEANYRMDRPPELQGVWTTSVGLPRVQPRKPDPGGGIVVALVDTAVQPLPGPLNEFLLPGLRVAEGDGPPADLPTHGTAMAQTLLRGLEMVSGPESKVRVLPVDIYGGREVTSTFDLALGLYLAVYEGGARLVNLSLGSQADSPLVHDVVRQVSGTGVLVVAAAGNEPTTAPVYPAAYPEVVAVTAGDRSGGIAPYANRGEFVDVVAPGASVVFYEGRPFLVMGTSAAAAFTSGLAAGLAESRPGQVKDLLPALQAILGTPGR